ncbi:MAG: hypothetical protein U0176_21740 [Bacteroidia bacterium]
MNASGYIPRWWTAALWITGATLLLGYLAFYNGFPLLYPDTGTYIESGFSGKVPIDRPIFYGLFIRHISLAESPWLVIMAQNVLLAWLIWLTVARFIRSARVGYYYIGIVFVLAMTTQVSYYSNLLIADIFTPMAFLSAFHLAFWEEHRWPRRVFLVVLVAFSLMSHLSNFPTILISMAVSLLVAWWLRKRRPAPFQRLSVAILSAVVLVSLLAVPLINAAIDGKFRYAEGGSVFMTNRLRDLDLVKEFLDAACPTEDWKLCPYKDELYGDFLWAMDYSPLYKIGGWEANFDEFSRMNRRILMHPGRLLKFSRATFEEGIRQLFVFQVPAAGPMLEESAAGNALKFRFPHSLRGMLAAKQIRNDMDFKDLNKRQVWMVVGSMAMLFLLAVDRKRFLRLPDGLRWFMLTLSLFILANDFICASLSNIDPRYMGRLAWLLPMTAMVIAAFYVEKYGLPDRLRAWLDAGKQKG